MAKWDGARLRRSTRVAPVAAVMAALTLMAGCGGGENERAPDAKPRRVVEVQQVRRDRWEYARARFNELCAGCHSLSDAGARGRRYHLDHTVDLDETRVRWVIAEGEPGMPAYRGVLSKREFEELVAYVSAVDKHTPGDNYYGRQLKMRNDGEKWDPRDPR